MTAKFSLLAAATAFAIATVAAPVLAESGPNDAQIAHIAYTAGALDVAAAKQALAKSQDKEVRAFASTMLRDHEAVNEKALALVKKLGVTPKENAVGKQLLSDAAKTEKMLRSKDGEAFDKAYVDSEVAYHVAVISAVESLLIPETENAELKDLLQNVVPALKALWH